LQQFPPEITTNHAMFDQVKAKWGERLEAYRRSKNNRG